MMTAVGYVLSQPESVGRRPGYYGVRRPWTGAVGKSAPMDRGYLLHGTNTPAVGLFSHGFGDE